MMWNYGVPLHLIRELYETFRNFKIRVADYIRYHKVTSNMNDRFPDATAEELNSNDTTCIICREEMTTAKKLICGHLFHVHCLRSWLERQNTCPTCRAHVIPPDNATTPASGVRRADHQQGSSTPGASSSSSSLSQGSVAATDSVSHHQARLQAAASAAAIYQKSFVYPSPNTLPWSSPASNSGDGNMTFSPSQIMQQQLRHHLQTSSSSEEKASVSVVDLEEDYI